MKLTYAHVEKMTVEERSVLALGFCPECHRHIKGWKAPTGAMAPEVWQSLREQGVCPDSGHLKNCLLRDLEIS